MTQDKRKALEALLAKVEAGGDIRPHEFDHVFDPRYLEDRFAGARAYRGSLDADKALHEAVLPTSQLAGLMQFSGRWSARIIPEQVTANHEDPARAWLIAILKALIAQEQA